MREPVNAISHLVACLLSIGGAVYLVTKQANPCLHSGVDLWQPSFAVWRERALPRRPLSREYYRSTQAIIPPNASQAHTHQYSIFEFGQVAVGDVGLNLDADHFGLVLKVALFNLPRSWSTMFMFSGLVGGRPLHSAMAFSAPTAIALLVTEGYATSAGPSSMLQSVAISSRTASGSTKYFTCLPFLVRRPLRHGGADNPNQNPRLPTTMSPTRKAP